MNPLLKELESLLNMPDGSNYALPILTLRTCYVAIAELEKDKARLDWIELAEHRDGFGERITHAGDVRRVIDAQMEIWKREGLE